MLFRLHILDFFMPIYFLDNPYLMLYYLSLITSKDFWQLFTHQLNKATVSNMFVSVKIVVEFYDVVSLNLLDIQT